MRRICAHFLRIAAVYSFKESSARCGVSDCQQAHSQALTSFRKAAPEANPSLASYCQWADNLEAQFACAEQLVEEGRAFFDPENLERLKSLPLSEESARFMRSVQWNGIMAVSKRKLGNKSMLPRGS